MRAHDLEALHEALAYAVFPGFRAVRMEVKRRGAPVRGWNRFIWDIPI